VSEEVIVDGERPTILIVDDDEEIIALLTEHFKARNCEAIATANPLTVVDKLRNFSIKLMLLDLKMKELDGFRVLDRIKQAGLSLPPTLIITGFRKKYEDELLKHGISAEDIVEKPFHFDVMEERINRKLGREIVISEVGSEYENKLYRNNRCRLGFVEDEEDLTKILGSFFEERNYKVYCYRNGTVALEGLKANPVDIVFVDIKLPGIQGDQLIEALSKLPKLPSIIPMSADPLSDEVKAKLEILKCEEFLEKPFDLIKLIELVKTIAIQKGLLG